MLLHQSINFSTLTHRPTPNQYLKCTLKIKMKTSRCPYTDTRMFHYYLKLTKQLLSLAPLNSSPCPVSSLSSSHQRPPGHPVSPGKSLPVEIYWDSWTPAPRRFGPEASPNSTAADTGTSPRRATSCGRSRLLPAATQWTQSNYSPFSPFPDRTQKSNVRKPCDNRLDGRAAAKTPAPGPHPPAPLEF